MIPLQASDRSVCKGRDSAKRCGEFNGDFGMCMLCLRTGSGVGLTYKGGRLFGASLDSSVHSIVEHVNQPSIRLQDAGYSSRINMAGRRSM